MKKASRLVIAASMSASLLSGMMISSASAAENVLGWKTANPGHIRVFTIYPATGIAPLLTSGTVGWKTVNPGRTGVFDAYKATRTPPPNSSGVVRIYSAKAARNDVYDRYND
jgi:hypothetical protein